MGLNNNSVSAIYLQVSKGKLVRQFQNATEKSVQRVNKNGKLVHEEFYDSLTANLKDIKVKDSEYGRFWTLTFNDGQMNYLLDLNFSGGYATSFLKALPNADLSKPMTIVPKFMEDGDKKSSVLFINQDGRGLKHFWTKDNPGDLPNLQKIKIKGKESWDDSERLEFLQDYVNKNILPKIASDSLVILPKENAGAFEMDDDAPF